MKLMILNKIFLIFCYNIFVRIFLKISLTESSIIFYNNNNNNYNKNEYYYNNNYNAPISHTNLKQNYYLGQKPIVVKKTTKYNNNNNNNGYKTYSITNENKRYRRSVFLPKQYSIEKYILQSNEKPAINKTRLSPRPRFLLSRNVNLTPDPSVFMCNNKLSNICRNKTMIFRNRILNEFKKSIEEIVNEPIYYNVKYKTISTSSTSEYLLINNNYRNNYNNNNYNKNNSYNNKNNKYNNDNDYDNNNNNNDSINTNRNKFISIITPTCLLLRSNIRVLRRKDPPFNFHPLGRILPKKKIFKNLNNVKNCAIVSSAGSLNGSKLGKFIDLHDIVMRFNHAPIEGYETDVGSKTTIRVVNSQVVTKSEYNFINDEIFQNITIAAWDPGKYNSTLKDWLNNADFNLFTNYEIYRKKYPKSLAYLIDPNSIWNLWNILQTYTGLPIRKNPPSSGFIGLAFLLPYCPYIDFIEYIPSTRLNGRCHYYSNEMNAACTFGAWHPLAAEKMMTLSMNIADNYAVFQNGITRIRRPDKNVCNSIYV